MKQSVLMLFGTKGRVLVNKSVLKGLIVQEEDLSS
jgi:hypothetical protein